MAHPTAQRAPDPPAPDPVDLAFHFETGRLCLNFTATLAQRHGASFDRWQAPTDLARWCAAAGLLAPARIAATDLAKARNLREAIYRLVQARASGRAAKPADIALVNNWAAQPVAAPLLDANAAGITFTARDPLAANLSAVARDAIDLVTGPDLARLRECAEHSCSVLFVDRSRPGKRRWCSMNRCGNKVKKAAFRQRQAEA
jgi:predicted RNA-binding Zn ribbon-like protein